MGIGYAPTFAVMDCMKILYIILTLLIAQQLKGQENAKFEQAAFEFYLADLADSSIKGTLWIDLTEFHDDPFWMPNCLNDFN